MLALFADGPAKGRVMEVTHLPVTLFIPGIPPLTARMHEYAATIEPIPIHEYRLMVQNGDAGIYRLPPDRFRRRG